MPPPPSRQELDDLFSLVYEELRRLARTVMRNERGAHISPTTLVHAVWLKFSKAPEVASVSRVHFQNTAAKAMRYILVDAVRHNRAAMRGGGVEHVTFDPAVGPATPVNGREFEALHTALDRLEKLDKRQVEVVEAHYFGGLTFDECGELLNISSETAQRDWRAARAWLRYEVARELHLDEGTEAEKHKGDKKKGDGHES